jgi:hypothetical protein
MSQFDPRGLGFDWSISYRAESWFDPELVQAADAAAATPGAPWYLWPIPLPAAEPPFDIRRANHTLLHQYRQPFQTVGQPWSLLFPLPKPRLDPEPNLARAADHTALHLYRVGYQTVGQPWQALFVATKPRLEPETYIVRPTDQTPLYGRTTPVTATVGAPWFIWQPSTRLEDQLFDVRRTDHTLLHLYRVGYQTVGQPWRLLFQPPTITLQPEAFAQPVPNYGPLFGRTIVLIPQPWNLYTWQTPAPDTTWPPYDHYRPRDYWSQLLPFLITPTNPIVTGSEFIIRSRRRLRR